MSHQPIQTLIVPGDFVHTLSNIHIYKNHIRPLTEQISRIPRKFPTLEIRTKNRNIDRFSYKDFVLKIIIHIQL